MNAIVTIAIGETYEAIARMTHPSLKAYAERVGAEFVVIDERLVSETTPHYEKFQLRDLLNRYERIIYLDTDIIVREDCPNLFDVVKPNMIGLFDEGRIMDRTAAMRLICMEMQEEIKKWQGEYYNTGVMVISRIHKDLFKKPEKETNNFYEQSYLNLRIIKDEYKVHSLDYRFNRMNCMDAETGEHRLKSFVVHYAGVLNGLDRLIPEDLGRWQSGEWRLLRRNIVVAVGNNRLGDNVSAEPVARYIVENTPDANITVAAIYPEVFGHLSDKATVVALDKFKYQPDTAYLHINTGVDEMDPIKQYITCDTMNMTDFTSLVCLKRVLPDDCKQPMLAATINGVSEVISAAEGPLNDFFLVHPGKGWPSKTFPKSWWDDVISRLLASGKKVAVIGADTKNGQGTVDVDIPDGVIDLRNLLSVQGLIAAISMAPCLISNDSGPVHIASAFDNRIVLIPTCKHPDLILPPRRGMNGARYGKAVAVYKKLTCGGYDPCDASGGRLEDVDGNIEDYLPSPEKVVSVALSDAP